MISDIQQFSELGQEKNQTKSRGQNLCFLNFSVADVGLELKSHSGQGSFLKMLNSSYIDAYGRIVVIDERTKTQ